jgi:hypothetical protein
MSKKGGRKPKKKKVREPQEIAATLMLIWQSVRAKQEKIKRKNAPKESLMDAWKRIREQEEKENKGKKTEFEDMFTL